MNKCKSLPDNTSLLTYTDGDMRPYFKRIITIQTILACLTFLGAVFMFVIGKYFLAALNVFACVITLISNERHRKVSAEKDKEDVILND